VLRGGEEYMAKVLYTDAATSGTSQAIQIDTNQAVGDDGDRIIKKIFVGKPVAGASITIFSINNALANNTTQIIFKYTYPTFGAGTPATDNFNFVTSEQAASATAYDGLICSAGGSIVTSSAMQVSVLWDLPEA
jgi:hypothetical protein